MPDAHKGEMLDAARGAAEGDQIAISMSGEAVDKREVVGGQACCKDAEDQNQPDINALHSGESSSLLGAA
jgi:hypothetical protein